MPAGMPKVRLDALDLDGGSLILPTVKFTPPHAGRHAAAATSLAARS